MLIYSFLFNCFTFQGVNNNSYFYILLKVKFVDYYRKIDLAKKMNGSINGMQINCPKTVAKFFSLCFILNRKIMN